MKFIIMPCRSKLPELKELDSTVDISAYAISNNTLAQYEISVNDKNGVKQTYTVIYNKINHYQFTTYNRWNHFYTILVCKTDVNNKIIDCDENDLENIRAYDQSMFNSKTECDFLSNWCPLLSKKRILAINPYI